MTVKELIEKLKEFSEASTVQASFIYSVGASKDIEYSKNITKVYWEDNILYLY